VNPWLYLCASMLFLLLDVFCICVARYGLS